MKGWISRSGSGSGDRGPTPGAPRRGTSLWILAALALAALAVAALGGCGDVSLLNNLEAEDEALPIGLAPQDPHVPARTAVTLSVLGGVAPYSFTLRGPGALILTEDAANAASITYLAPDVLGAEQITVTVSVEDFFGKAASREVTAYRPLTVDPAASFSVYRAAVQDLRLSGGVRPYTVTPAAGTGSFVDASTYRYVPPPAGASDSIEIRDDVGNRRSLVVTVVDPPAPGEIMLDPPAASVGFGESASFVVTGGTPPYLFTYAGTGSIAWDGTGAGSTVTYTPPDVAGTETVTVTDSSTPLVKTADFTVEVLAPPSPLAVTFNGDPPTAPDEHIQLTSGQTILVEVSGGVQPYTFDVLADDDRASGTLDVQPPDRALYTAPTIPKVPPLFERIKVSDSNGGETVVQQVKVMP